MVTQEQNDKLTSKPTMNELQEMVFSTNPNSAGGNNCINGYFFQKCLKIINQELMGVVLACFSGKEILKYFSHCCIVILPKLNNPSNLKEFRPIILSNFISKIIFKLLSKRLSSILPNLISLNKSVFVKGRSIT